MSNYDDLFNGDEVIDDFFDDYDEEDSYKEKEKRAAQRRKEDRKHKRKARKIWAEGSFYGGYYPVDKHGNYADEEENIAYFKREDTGKRSRFLKKQSNRKIRQDNSDEALKGGEYKKKFDYRWELY